MELYKFLFKSMKHHGQADEEGHGYERNAISLDSLFFIIPSDFTHLKYARNTLVKVSSGLPEHEWGTACAYYRPFIGKPFVLVESKSVLKIFFSYPLEAPGELL